jgi:5-methylcytosine-specific restriction endonuclease McrA
VSTKNNRKRLARVDDLYGLQPNSKRRWRQVLEILGTVCLKCGAAPITRDHVVPIARGGLNHPANLQPLCRPCNNHKGDQIMDYRTDAQRSQILKRWPLEPVPIERYQNSMSTTLAELIGSASRTTCD